MAIKTTALMQCVFRLMMGLVMLSCDCCLFHDGDDDDLILLYLCVVVVYDEFVSV